MAGPHAPNRGKVAQPSVGKLVHWGRRLNRDNHAKDTRMLNQLRIVVVVLSMTACAADAAGTVEFNRDIRPILSNHCFTCHGPDGGSREAGLRLDRRDDALAVGDSGKRPIVPGDVNSSEIIRRVMAHGDERMPPEDGPAPLNSQQIETLNAWIAQGAEYETHWAFVAPKAGPVPADKLGRARNAIDRFVQDRLLRDKLSPSAEAKRQTQIRRVAFDITGLPPTLIEIDNFVNDESPSAYERMVDRYFDSPAYGEHMARHWLDLARYADTNGYQYDTERQQWVWRDWVIDAYNRNMPFDQFTTQQLAGDLLPDSTPQQRLATGFNRNHSITIEGGIISEEYRTEYVMDRVVTTSQVWLGLTMGCARCHDHKYDPISQKEFYQTFAYFNQVPERGNSGFDPRETIPSPLAKSGKSSGIGEQLADLKTQLANPVALESQLATWTQQLAASSDAGWNIQEPLTMKSSGGSKMTKLDDGSIVFGGANPDKDTYEITARTEATNITAVRLEALTHDSLPAKGPGRHSNSNFVLSEFEVVATSVRDPKQSQKITFARAIADYSQANYEIHKAIDGVPGNSGWAVDGPTRKQNATAAFIAETPFGFEGGTQLLFRLRHDANFRTHGVGRPRLSLTTDSAKTLTLQGVPADIRTIAAKPSSSRSNAEAKQLSDYFMKHHDPRDALKQKIAKLEKQLTAGTPATMVMRDMPSPRKTFVLNRGEYDSPAEEVKATTPAVFPSMPKNAPANRLGFADWLTSPNHPLTARVAVNRYWQRLFGTGLVKTSEDFGVQGELPSHPQLLDWLALEFVRSGWDVKHIQRLMIMSATYRQSSHAKPAQWQQDPENRMLARGPRMRLDGEEIRDAMLFTSGQLVDHRGGPSVYPYQPKGLWMELNNRPGYSKAYAVGSGDDLYRRSLYTFWKRTVPSPMLKTLDAPEREFCTIRRSRTNTPLQALLLMNGPQFVEAARNLGQRMMKHGGRSTDERIVYAFRLVTARRPTTAELSVLREAYAEEFKRSQNQDIAKQSVHVGASPVASELNLSELSAYTSVARLIMNLNEAITKG